MVDRWRRHTLPGPTGGDFTPEVEVNAPDPMANEFTDEMQHALNRLPMELRESLLLVIVGDLTHQEVANLLKVPLGSMIYHDPVAWPKSQRSLRPAEFWK